MKKTILHLVISVIIISITQTRVNSQPNSNWFWQQPLPTGNLLYAIKFANAQTGYAAGVLGTIMKTTNGGANWFLQNSNDVDILADIECLTPDRVFIVGRQGTILYTSNGGTNWIQQTSNVGNYLRSVSFPTQNTGYTVGNGGTILKTTNGGSNWIQQTSGTGAAFFSVSFCDSLNGFIGGNGGIVTTTDGGANWILNPLILPQLTTIAFVNCFTR